MLEALYACWMVVKCFLGFDRCGQALRDHGLILRHYVLGSRSSSGARDRRVPEFWSDLLLFLPLSKFVRYCVDSPTDGYFYEELVHDSLVFTFSLRLGVRMIASRVRELGILGDFTFIAWVRGFVIIFMLYFCGLSIEMVLTMFFQFFWKLGQNCDSLAEEMTRLNELTIPSVDFHLHNHDPWSEHAKYDIDHNHPHSHDEKAGFGRNCTLPTRWSLPVLGKRRRSSRVTARGLKL